jgi:hypothetical protein
MESYLFIYIICISFLEPFHLGAIDLLHVKLFQLFGQHLYRLLDVSFMNKIEV